MYLGRCVDPRTEALGSDYVAVVSEYQHQSLTLPQTLLCNTRFSTSFDDTTHLYAMLSDALGGPRISPVHRPKLYPIGIGIVESERTHHSFGFVADVHGPPTGY